MGCCASAPDGDINVKRLAPGEQSSSGVMRKLPQDPPVYKLLFLGAGESGKSLTIFILRAVMIVCVGVRLLLSVSTLDTSLQGRRGRLEAGQRF